MGQDGATPLFVPPASVAPSSWIATVCSAPNGHRVVMIMKIVVAVTKVSAGFLSTVWSGRAFVALSDAPYMAPHRVQKRIAVAATGSRAT